MEFRDWFLSVFERHMDEFHLGGSWTKTVFFCYLCCASELVKVHGNYKWFAKPIESMAQDAKTSPRTVNRYLNDLIKSGLVEKQKKLLGTKILLMTRVTELAMQNREFVTTEVGRLSPSQIGIFLSELVPIDNIVKSIHDAFVA